MMIRTHRASNLRWEVQPDTPLSGLDASVTWKKVFAANIVVAQSQYLPHFMSWIESNSRYKSWHFQICNVNNNHVVWYYLYILPKSSLDSRRFENDNDIEYFWCFGWLHVERLGKGICQLEVAVCSSFFPRSSQISLVPLQDVLSHLCGLRRVGLPLLHFAQVAVEVTLTIIQVWY